MTRHLAWRYGKTLLGVGLVGLAVYFIGRLVADQWSLIAAGPRNLRWDLLAAGLTIMELYSGYQILLWRRVMARLGSRLPLATACRMYFTTNLLAYIPGKVANFIGMAALAKRLDVSPLRTAKTMILFQIYALISGTAVVAAAGAFVGDELGALLPGGWQAILWLAAGIGLVLISPPVIRITLGLIRRLTGLEAGDIVLPFKSHFVHLVLYGAGWFVLGAAMWCLVAAFGARPLEVDFLAVVVVVVASYLAGLLAFMVPAGIGVAEAGLVYGFMRFCDVEQAVFGAVSLRLAGVATSLLSLLIILGLARRSRKRAAARMTAGG